MPSCREVLMLWAMVATFTEHLKALQQQHVPHRQYTSKPTDQPWFGYRCRCAAERKYSAWLRFKRNPTSRNKARHRAACKSMVATCRWAQQRWERDLQSKLCGPGVGSKTWWALVKERQGGSHHETIPPLTKQDGTTATSSKEKAKLLADLFSTKMSVPDPNRPPPQMDQECDQALTEVMVTQEQVERLLRAVDVRKATGPDDISPQVLRHCSEELAWPLTKIFTACAREKTWPVMWNKARVVPIHTKNQDLTQQITGPSPSCR